MEKTFAVCRQRVWGWTGPRDARSTALSFTSWRYVNPGYFSRVNRSQWNLWWSREKLRLGVSWPRFKCQLPFSQGGLPRAAYLHLVFPCRCSPLKQEIKTPALPFSFRWSWANGQKSAIETKSSDKHRLLMLQCSILKSAQCFSNRFMCIAVLFGLCFFFQFLWSPCTSSK